MGVGIGDVAEYDAFKIAEPLTGFFGRFVTAKPARVLIEPVNMYCTQCGTQLAETARFCTACGKPTAPGIDVTPVAAAPKKLRRIREGKKIAGVCAGFAEYFDTDVTVMRLIWVALALLPPNIGLIGYIVAWVVLPKP
jgi:phage shock protein C